MRAHELGRLLLAGPDLPVTVDEGTLSDAGEVVATEVVTERSWFRAAPRLDMTDDPHIEFRGA